MTLRKFLWGLGAAALSGVITAVAQILVSGAFSLESIVVLISAAVTAGAAYVQDPNR